MLDLLWMIVVGALIGVVASMFVKGPRLAGMGWTVFLGALGYGLAGFIGQSFHRTTLVQWLLGIAASSLMITGYLLMTGRRN